MPIQHADPLDKRGQESIKKRYSLDASKEGLDINDWIGGILTALSKKDDQYIAVRKELDSLLADFKTATGLSYEDWSEKRASDLLDASKGNSEGENNERP